ncbi:hypothetical protein K469DRAFT_750901 [Zopfia rhizophila CBS 207.26]|uniref:PHD-type domain-containing protein n=1 Tax=Zopfia rhizophila CBS 207.26 TaxID=1314779 RepID=A0A6A6DX49_9PEZI|nr:hypothetical protein K469DRAFT_750901 [Zopfia rhizophila CBS 207.26]
MELQLISCPRAVANGSGIKWSAGAFSDQITKSFGSNGSHHRPIKMLSNFNENNRSSRNAPGNSKGRGNNEKDTVGRAQNSPHGKARNPPSISPPPLKRPRLAMEASAIKDSHSPRLLKRAQNSNTEHKVLHTNDGPSLKLHSKDGQGSTVDGTTTTTNSKGMSPIMLVRTSKPQLNAGASPEPPHVRHVEINTSGSGVFLVPSTLQKGIQQQRLEAANLTSPFATPIHPHPRIQDDDETSMSSALTPSDFSAGSTKRVPTCRGCKSNSDLSYNRLVQCSSCTRHFHEGCRKPLLAGGSDRKIWKCYRCIKKEAKSSKSLVLPSKSPRRPSNAQASPRVEMGSVLPSTAGGDEGPRRDHKQSGNSESGNTFKEAHPDVVLRAATSKTADTLANIPTAKSIQKAELPKQTGTASTTAQIRNVKKRSRAAPSDDSKLIDAIQDEELDSMLLQSPVPRVMPNTFGPSGLSVAADHMEIPNTPTQISSQLPAEGSGFNHSPSYDDLVSESEQNESPQRVVPPRSKTNVSRSVPCSVCQKQRVLPWNGDDNPMCSRCKGKGTGLDNDKSTISILETPEAAPPLQKDAQGISNAEPTTVPNPTEQKEYAPWYRGVLGRSTSKKIVNKKVPRREAPVSLKTNAVDSASPIGDTVIPPGAPVNDGNEREDETRLPTRLQPPNVMTDDTSELTSLVDESPNDSEDVSRVISKTRKKKFILSFNPKLGTCKVLHREGNESPSSSESEVDTTSQEATSKTASYTTRQRIAMALLAAQDRALTSGEVKDWISDTFPELQRGGKWEASVSAVLSYCQDFSKGQQAGERTSVWSFSSRAIKQKAAKQFPEFCPTPPLRPKIALKTRPSNRNLGSRESTESNRRGEKEPRSKSQTAAIEEHPEGVEETNQTPTFFPDKVLPKSASEPVENGRSKIDSPNVEMMDANLTPASSGNTAADIVHGDDVGSSQEIRANSIRHLASTSDLVDEDAEIFTMPWDKNRCTELDPNLVIERDFFTAFPEFSTQMTTSEREKKIEQIKKRPSRKATFGKRLAFARIHRKDVHDELSWYRKTTYSHSLGQVQDCGVEMQDNQVETFRDIMDLPENAIPMVAPDGQLAFRDGVMVNGRLPRPKVIYKVGRHFAGNLK